MIVAPDERPPSPSLAPDVLVVGAGAVGIALAVLLARQGRRVTVLEGGPPEPPADFARANAARCTGRPHAGLVEGRMKALGGTTRLWGGQLVPFGAQDLAPGVFPGKAGWPIAPAELAAASHRALELLGVPAELRDPARVFAAATGLPDRLDSRLALLVTAWLPQPDFTRAFAAELADANGPCVITGRTVHALEFMKPGEVAAVHAAAVDGATLRLAAPVVVLAAGTFENVRLLLRAAAGSPDCGFAANRHVGRWFIDHLHGGVGRVENLDRRRIAALFDPLYRHRRKFTTKLRASDAFQAEQAMPNAAAMLLAPMGAREIAADLTALLRRIGTGRSGRGAVAAGWRQARLLAPFVWRYLTKRRAANFFATGAALGIEVEQVANPDSRITLDPDDPEKIVLHWAIDGREMVAVSALAKAIRDRFAADGLGRVVLDPAVEAGDPAALAGFHDAFHQMGGARMAATAEDGVVDGTLRVFGTRNLYVLGAATFPSGSFANPTLTALALAVRLADHLAERPQ